ncbi:phosphatase PAP2 family protein [Pseudonocardia sp. WMMC193]|uniref:phosphatase PAP2 family protein n=1 Tax=Pseudonocardia sp. WMMC193 TaxID=2911965 RepID=UPI001F2D38CE|nr:phosphatase PAP2 family protein [Pseudonocardia sp. WMMC193]MCF7552644.1 phosphatase PAP2 family protein [Pseudonocardia sp. WMMC193]
MWLADIEQRISVGLLALWLVVVMVVALRATRFPDSTPRWRTVVPTTALLVGVALVLFTAQATVVDAVADPGLLSAADGPVLDWMIANRTAALTVVAKAVTEGGSTVGMGLVAAVAAVVLWLRRRHRDALVTVLATGGAGLLVLVFKIVYARPRPPVATRLMDETNPSLPSGHALVSIVVLGTLCLILCSLARTTATRVALVAATLVLVVGIGLSRLYLGVHWVSDIATSWLLGGAWLAVCTIVLIAIQGRRIVFLPATAQPQPQPQPQPTS